MSGNRESQATNELSSFVWLSFISYVIFTYGTKAYNIRLYAIQEFGPIIHEFDPYFNWRATEYLYLNGWKNFVTWFDYKSWYPLGRPIGTTIYPGMQVTAVFLKNWIIGDKMSLNDICCYMPAWFGVSASVLTGLLAYECTLPQNTNDSIFTYVMDIYRGETRKVTVKKSYIRAMLVGSFTMAIMSMIPAHLMRSIGGGYDNESVAVTALTLTFWLWCRSLRANDDYSYLYGIATGFAYFYMVAAWGGYIFVLNLIGFHAALLVLLGRFTTKIYRAYSLFYVVGTYLAIQVPVVGLTPLKSLEQLGPAVVFLGYQILQYCEIEKKRKKLSRSQTWFLRIQVGLISLAVGIALIYMVAPTGYFGPISSRVRGLFVKHTKTGNPLVDSVAEHQPASSNAYYQYLQVMCFIAPIGFVVLLFNLGDASSFLLVYGLVAYFFSSKMVRLVLLLGPIASALGGVTLGFVTLWSLTCLIPWLDVNESISDNIAVTKGAEVPEKKKDAKKKKPKKAQPRSFESDSEEAFKSFFDALEGVFASSFGIGVKKLFAITFFIFFFFGSQAFQAYCNKLAVGLSNPAIVIKGTLKSGKTVIVDDYREAYFWLRDNTPDDARVLAWWDYGYQITGISNRTTLADGNTWNHEHIALLGKILTSSEEEGYEIAKHLADYALVWAGGGGDDVAKSPHLARIANSVYRDMCPGDPTCRSFAAKDQFGQASSMMTGSFLYKLHGNNVVPGVKADPNKFQEVFRSKYGKCRIYKILGVSKESKEWVVNNRVCDVPGSWYCPGQYPPALASVLSKRKDFAQLEDFNTKKSDDEYQKAYFKNLNDKSESYKKSKPKPKQKLPEEFEEMVKQAKEMLTPDDIELAGAKWEDTTQTTLMWELISSKQLNELQHWLLADPIKAFMRSDDGRGPMWWAYEKRNMPAAIFLTKLGVRNDLKDAQGKTPLDMLS